MGWLSLRNWIGALTLTLLLKLPPRKLKPWFLLQIFLVLKLLCIFINLTYDHTWYNIWPVAPSCFLELLDKLQKPLAYFELFSYRENVASLTVFKRYCFERFSFHVAWLVPILYSQGKSTHYSERLHYFSVTIPRCSRMYMPTVSLIVQLDSGVSCLQNAFLWRLI